MRGNPGGRGAPQSTPSRIPIAALIIAWKPPPQLASAATVSLAVYNSAGQLVCRMAAGHQQAGIYIQRWDGRAASGTYFYRLNIDADGPQLTRSMTLVR